MHLEQALDVAANAPRRLAEVSALKDRIGKTPESNRVHGMYVVGLCQLMRANGIEKPGINDAQRYRYYPLRIYMQLLAYCAVSLYPEQSLREGLRTLGQLVCPTFAESICGKVLMSVVGDNFELGLNVLTRGYQLSLRPGSASVTVRGRGQATVELREIWNFGDSYHAGIIEGLMKWCRTDGCVTPRVHSLRDTDLNVEWTIH